MQTLILCQKKTFIKVSSLKNLDFMANLTKFRILEIEGCSSLSNKDGIANPQL